MSLFNATNVKIGSIRIKNYIVRNEQQPSSFPKATSMVFRPDELKTPFVEERLNRLKGEGYLDDMFQPIKKKCPWSIASVIAKELGEVASIPNFYQVFGLFWKHTTLRVDYQGFLNNNRKATEIQENIHNLLL